MAENQLDEFLRAGTPAEAAQDAPRAPQEPERAAEAPAESRPSTPAPEGAKGTPAKPEAEPEHEEDIAPLSGADNRTVPFSALEKVRNDWKSKAAAAEAKAEELRRQLEEAKRPPPAPPPAPPQMQPMPLPDFNQDPQGYIHHLAVQAAQERLNERLNFSEHMMRDKVGAEQVDKDIADFKQLAAKDQTLWGKLYAQPMPYQWLSKEMERQRSIADLGDDPVAYRARIVAEERAKWEAELQQQQPAPQPSPYGRNARPSPVAGRAPSLAGTRSVAARSESTFTGPPSLDELFPAHRGPSRHN
jgi:hypothetical protein